MHTHMDVKIYVHSAVCAVGVEGSFGEACSRHWVNLRGPAVSAMDLMPLSLDLAM